MTARILVVLLVIGLLVGGLLYYRQLNLKKSTYNAANDVSLQKVIASKEFMVGSALEELPWGDIDKNTGEDVGAEVEIAKLVAEKMGVKLVLVNKGFDYLIPELQSKQYDMAMAGLSITDERKKLVNFTDPYVITGLAVITRKDNTTINTASDLEGKKIGVLAGTTSHDYVKTIKNADIRIYDDPGKYILDTKSGKIDATIYDATAAFAYLKANPDLKVAGPLLNKEYYGMAVRIEDRALLAKLNEVIASLKESGELKTITSKWYGPTE